MKKRVVRIISYEGNEQWVDASLRAGSFGTPNKVGDTIFSPYGTIKELHRIELQDGEDLVQAVMKATGWKLLVL